MESISSEEAFRRGVRGQAFGGGQRAADPPPAGGPNEAALLAMTRLPGLSDPLAAYETGRALRIIVRLFDQAGAPESVGRQFVDNLAAAAMAEHMRKVGRAWGAADTADMFVEMYARILGGRRPEHDMIRRAVMDHAVGHGEPDGAIRRGGLGSVFRRRRRRARNADDGRDG